MCPMVRSRGFISPVPPAGVSLRGRPIAIIRTAPCVKAMFTLLVETNGPGGFYTEIRTVPASSAGPGGHQG